MVLSCCFPVIIPAPSGQKGMQCSRPQRSLSRQRGQRYSRPRRSLSVLRGWMCKNGIILSPVSGRNAVNTLKGP
jgi:hypothetical protein